MHEENIPNPTSKTISKCPWMCLCLACVLICKDNHKGWLKEFNNYFILTYHLKWISSLPAEFLLIPSALFLNKCVVLHHPSYIYPLETLRTQTPKLLSFHPEDGSEMGACSTAISLHCLAVGEWLAGVGRGGDNQIDAGGCNTPSCTTKKPRK